MRIRDDMCCSKICLAKTALNRIEDERFKEFCTSLASSVKGIRKMPYFAPVSIIFIPLRVGLIFSELAIWEILGKKMGYKFKVVPPSQALVMILVVISTFGICWSPVSLFIAEEGQRENGKRFERRGFCDYSVIPSTCL